MFGEISNENTPVLNLESVPAPPGPVTIKGARRFTERDFYRFCVKNPDLTAELDQHGNLLIMPPVNPDSGEYEFEATGQLYNWYKRNDQGRAFSPSTAFKLPDGSVRCADGAWVGAQRLAQFMPAQGEAFALLVPDFVMEIRSSSDRIGKLRQKMTDVWIKNGVRLAWLIDPKQQKVYVYRADGSEGVVASFDGVLSGEDVCPGFEFELDVFKTKPS